MTLSLRRSASFLLGLGFSLLPLAGPFIGLLFLISTRLRLRRSDAVWTAAAFLSALALGVSGGLRGALFGLAQVALPWLVYRSFCQLAHLRSPLVQPRLLGAGLVVGLALVIAGSWLQIDALEFATAKTISQAIVWGTHPALFGHAVLVLGLLIAIVTPSSTLRLMSLGLSTLGILVSGSREAAIAWVLAVTLLVLYGGYRSLRTRLVEAALLVMMLVIAAGFSPLLGWGRVGFLLEAGGDAGRNLFQGTEIGYGDWWDTSWVTIDSGPLTIAGDTLTGYRVTKDGSDGWLRLQQIIELQPGKVYTLSAWIEGGGPNRPSLQGWGQYQVGDGVRTFLVNGALTESDWRATVSGEGELLDSGVASSDGTWRRAFVTFRTVRGRHPSTGTWVWHPTPVTRWGAPHASPGFSSSGDRSATTSRATPPKGSPSAWLASPTGKRRWMASAEHPGSAGALGVFPSTSWSDGPTADTCIWR